MGLLQIFSFVARNLVRPTSSRLLTLRLNACETCPGDHRGQLDVIINLGSWPSSIHRRSLSHQLPILALYLMLKVVRTFDCSLPCQVCKIMNSCQVYKTW
jgi:hypothetical protein